MDRVIKYFAFSIIIAFLFCFCYKSKAKKSKILYPEISFSYDWKSRVIDFIGGIIFRNKVNAQHRMQLTAQLPNLVAAWEHNAPMLFNEIFSYFNRGFRTPKRNAYIYLSNNSSYGSSRFLILGLRYYLEPEQGASSTKREDCFIDLVFHELLHIWVDDNIGGNSLLLKKYHYEQSDVLDHIHLMAIQKMVYLKLNRQDMLDLVDENYRKLSSAEYQRAWQIVNDIEGHEVIVKDIMDKFKLEDDEL